MSSASSESNAPSTLARDSWYRYTNERFEFSIEVPPGFEAVPPPQNGDGRLFTRGGARLRVSGRHNLDDSFERQVRNALQGLSDVVGQTTSPASWRGHARGAEGQRVMLRLARGEDRIVTVRIDYPAGDSGLTEIAQRALDSMLFADHAGPLSFRYQPERFSLVPAPISLPGAHDKPIEAVKLIPWVRAEQLGQRRCSYGLSGLTQICTVNMEAGLAFAALNRSIAELRKTVPATLVEPSRPAGRDGFRAVEKVEGFGSSYAFVPAGSATVVVVNQFRPDDKAASFRAVLRSLSVDPNVAGNSRTTR